MQKSWMAQVPQQDLQHYSQIGMLSRGNLGGNPALIVVDATFGFCGSEGLSLEDAIREFPTACGPSAWEAVPKIARLLALFRSAGRSVVFTHSDERGIQFVGSVGKFVRREEDSKYNEFPPAIAPLPTEWVIAKTKASAFFQTPLTTYLAKRSIDSVIICGGSTSGCVRASGVDSASYGYKTFVVEDACFDRSYYAHCANLFDLHAKYATVLSVGELETALGTSGSAEQMRARR